MPPMWLARVHRRWKRRIAWHVLAAGAVASGALLLFAKVGEDVFEHESGSFDATLRAWMLARRTPALFHVFTWITNAGSSASLVSVTLLVSLWLWHFKGRHAAAAAILAPLVAVALYNGVKLFHWTTDVLGGWSVGLFVAAVALALALLLVLAHTLGAQSTDSSDTPRLDRRFLRPRELAASALLSTLTAGGLVLYGVDRLSHARGLTDVAKHVTEAVVLTSLASQAIRGPLGRSRPYVTGDSDQCQFQAFEGFRRFDNRAWPSLHSATALAAGSALVAEVGERHPRALPWAAPLVYAAAALPGLSRMYLDQHGASDVLAGDVLGAVIGGRLVHYAHSSAPGAGPRWLVNASVAPSNDGAPMLMLSVRPR